MPFLRQSIDLLKDPALAALAALVLHLPICVHRYILLSAANHEIVQHSHGYILFFDLFGQRGRR
jgi:hypothetical protein